MLDFFKLPHSLQEKVVSKYMEYVKEPSPFVMQSHVRGKSQHLDFRMKVDGYLIGWSLVGGSLDNPITPERILKEKAKGFRAQSKCFSLDCNEWIYDLYEIDGEFYSTKASPPHLLSIEELGRQPIVWLKVEGEVKPGDPGAGVEAPGIFKILAKGQSLTGSQKVWFHEYFIRGGPFKDWTRLIVRAVRVPRLEPKTKEPIKGQFERFWRAMIPVEQMPYAMSNRAIKENWKPPKGIIPFPAEWAKKNFPGKYANWIEYMKGAKGELSKNISYTLALHKYRGPIHIRGMFRLDWYLFLDDAGKGQVRTFNIKGDPMREHIIEAWYEGRDSRKYLVWEAKTKPMSRFNPNKKLYGEMKVLERDKAGYESKIEEGKELIELQFKGEILKGTWKLEQEEKRAESYAFSQVKSLTEQLDSLAETEFVYHKHFFNDKVHYDLRIKRDDYLDEFNIDGNLLELKTEEPAFSIRKKCLEVEKWFIKEGKGIKRKVGKLETNVDVLDAGTLKIIEDNPQFISMHFQGKKLKGYVVALKNKGWIVKKAKLPKALAGEGDPTTGNYYKPFIIEQKKGWDYFIVNIYDIRNFTRCESESKLKDYGILPGKIPSGVFMGICLYSRPGKIHGARIAHVRFPIKDWTPEKAIQWIKSNKYHIWEAEQVRKRKEELAATLYPWMEIKKMDLPDRSCHGTIYTETGARDIILRAWTDDLALEILELYTKGITMFRFRVYGGFITQVIDYKGKVEEIPELA